VLAAYWLAVSHPHPKRVIVVGLDDTPASLVVWMDEKIDLGRCSLLFNPARQK
jgi:hypothetical protein